MPDKEHDKYAEHVMDTNGYGQHPDLLEQAQKRFLKAALAYCDHILSGDHNNCKPSACQYHLGLMDAHHVLVTS